MRAAAQRRPSVPRASTASAADASVAQAQHEARLTTAFDDNDDMSIAVSDAQHTTASPRSHNASHDLDVLELSRSSAPDPLHGFREAALARLRFSREVRAAQREREAEKQARERAARRAEAPPVRAIASGRMTAADRTMFWEAVATGDADAFDR